MSSLLRRHNRIDRKVGKTAAGLHFLTFLFLGGEEFFEEGGVWSEE